MKTYRVKVQGIDTEYLICADDISEALDKGLLIAEEIKKTILRLDQKPVDYITSVILHSS